MITLFPITSWRGSSRGGPAGENWPGYATADRTHPFAAAIMAQEIYESRYKSVRLLAVFAAVMAAYTLATFAFPIRFQWAVAVFALVIAILAVGLVPKWKQTLELRGQMIECIVRRNVYVTYFDTATAEALQQLKGYAQFDGWSADNLRSRFLDEQDYCGKWVGRNRELIDRIVADLAA